MQANAQRYRRMNAYTLEEFKAYVAGMDESIEEAPTQKQWAKVKEMLNNTTCAPIYRNPQELLPK